MPRRCPECNRRLLDLVTTQLMRPGQRITASPTSGLITDPRGAAAVRIYCDGSYRGPGAGGGSGKGGAAALAICGGQVCGAISEPLHACASAEEAEAHGVALAIRLAHTHSAGRDTAILGDNHAVMAYCAGAGRLRRTEAALVLNRALGWAAANGTPVVWLHIHRDDNGQADALAKAARRLATGEEQPGRRLKRRRIAAAAPRTVRARAHDPAPPRRAVPP